MITRNPMQLKANYPPISVPLTVDVTTGDMITPRESDRLHRLWDKYTREYEYAKGISFEDTCSTIQSIMDSIMH